MDELNREALMKRSRAELDALALESSVESPEKLPNKGAVIDAILESFAAADAARDEDGALDPEIDPVTGEPWRAAVNGEEISGEEAREVVLRNRERDAFDDAHPARPQPAPEAPEIDATGLEAKVDEFAAHADAEGRPQAVAEVARGGLQHVTGLGDILTPPVDQLPGYRAELPQGLRDRIENVGGNTDEKES